VGPDFGSRSRREGALQILGRGRDRCAEQLCAVCRTHRDWTIGPLLTKLEEYNGLGYAARGVPSPYVWSGTDQYRSGKYVRDGIYDPNAVDSQPGCAGLLMAMTALDPTISFSGPALAPNTSKTPIAKPSLTKPAHGSIGAWVASIFSAIFKSKGK